MTTFVLVHGGWSGAHTWRHVRSRLQDAGHQVFTPCLTGLGARSHLVGPWVDLSTHVRDVVGTILYEDLRDVVLAGHSYGGAVVTGAIDHVGDRVAELVYLDAFVPAAGESVFSVVDAGAGGAGRIVLGEAWLVPPVARSFDDPAEAEFTNARRVPHPIGCFTEAVRLSRPIEAWPFGRSYVKATASPVDDPGEAVFRALAEHARTSPAWRLHEIDGNHMLPNNRPAEVAAFLLTLA